MSVTHVALIHASPDANKESLSELLTSALELKEKCVRDGKPYIKSITAGADMSIEGMQGGITHAIVVEFASKEDRDYYVKEDSAHQAVSNAMIARLGTDIVTAQVVDFMPGSF